MIKKIAISLLFFLIGQGAWAQVKDISFTLSPVGEYTFWDDKAGINDGTMIGGKIGFGFGEYVELRGIYLQSIDLNTYFDDFGIPNYNKDFLVAKDVTVSRWGGEFKANIGTKRFNPYITLGTGVQTIEMDEQESTDQIYANLGLGLTFKLGNRTTFMLEGKNTTYNFNAGQEFLTDSERALFGLTEADFSRKRLSNWSVQGGLQFYLGGREPGTLSELDQAYLDQFRGGFKGLKIVVEPSGHYIDFDSNSTFRDTYLLGAYAGLDFNEFIGIRGFYFQATNDDELSFDFDKLAMYGLEFRARLNDGTGVTPFLTLGGGYLDPESSYLGKDDTSLKGTGFATGGLGMDIPLSRNLAIIGGVRAMFSSNESAEDISVSNDIQTHLMYNAGLTFTLGKNSKSPQAIYQRNVDREIEVQKAINAQKIQKLKEDHQKTIADLEAELKIAYEQKDVNKAVELLEEKKEAEEALDQIEVLEVQNKSVTPPVAEKVETPPAPEKVTVVQPEQALVVEPAKPVMAAEKPAALAPEPAKLIQMSPVEFELLIQRILQSLDATPATSPAPSLVAPIQKQQSPLHQQEEINSLKKRIDYLENLLMEMQPAKGIDVPAPIPSSEQPEVEVEVEESSTDVSVIIMERLDELNRKIDETNSRINTKNLDGQTVIVTPPTEEKATITRVNKQGKVVDVKKIKSTNSLLMYKNSSAILGFNYGGASTANIGVRLHYDLNNTPFEFMPEGYVGFGEATSYGMSGNVIYQFMKSHPNVQPYLGLGLGVASIDSDFHGNYNVIIGAQLPVLYPNLYVDYTMRNSFEYNQIAVGYKFSF
ncbi:hypothetical protein [Mangrovibacterium sp.]|uniref:hypothetical protein n=1 Tax=Mangrovibacterium sp. TaxID=1961364 RepID=UPI0035641FA5